MTQETLDGDLAGKSKEPDSSEKQSRVDRLKKWVTNVLRGVTAEGEHLLSQEDIDRLSALTTTPTGQELEELFRTVKKNRRIATIIRASALTFDNAVLREIETGQAYTRLRAAVFLTLSILTHVYEYSFRNKSQDNESFILENAFAELLLLHKDSLATIDLPEAVMQSFPRSAAGSIANAERARGASSLEMVGTLALTSINTLAMQRYVEFGVLVGMTGISVPALKQFYQHLKQLSKEYQEIKDVAMANIGQEHRHSNLDLLKDITDRMARIKNRINLLQRGLSRLLQLVAFLSKQVNVGAIDLGFASALAGIFTDAVGAAIGMQMLKENGVLARERLNHILTHIEEQKLAIADAQAWDAHRNLKGSEERVIPTGVKKAWHIQNFTVKLHYVGEQDAADRNNGERVFLDGASVSLEKGKIYALRGTSGEGKSFTIKSLAQSLNHDEGSHLFSVDDVGEATNIHEYDWSAMRQQVKYYEGSDYRSGLTLKKVFWDALFFNKTSEVFDFWDDFTRNSGVSVDRSVRKTVDAALQLLSGEAV